MSLLKEINQTVTNLDSLCENIEVPSEKTLSNFDVALIETAESLLGKVFAQVGASKAIDQNTANIVMGLYALGNKELGPQIQQQMSSLGKQGTPLKVALQLAGDDEQVNKVLATFGEQYASANREGQPWQIRNMLVGANVLDANQRDAVKKILQKAQQQYRVALSKQSQQTQQNQKTPTKTTTPQMNVTQAGMTNMGTTTPVGSVA